jgi:hypothetical protein
MQLTGLLWLANVLGRGLCRAVEACCVCLRLLLLLALVVAWVWHCVMRRVQLHEVGPRLQMAMAMWVCR